MVSNFDVAIFSNHNYVRLVMVLPVDDFESGICGFGFPL